MHACTHKHAQAHTHTDGGMLNSFVYCSLGLQVTVKIFNDDFILFSYPETVSEIKTHKAVAVELHWGACLNTPGTF